MYSKHCKAECRGMIWLYSGSFPWTYLSLRFPSPIEVELGAPSPLGQSILPPLLFSGKDRRNSQSVPLTLSRTLECSAREGPRPQGRRSLHNGGVTNLSSSRVERSVKGLLRKKAVWLLGSIISISEEPFLTQWLGLSDSPSVLSSRGSRFWVCLHSATYSTNTLMGMPWLLDNQGTS